MRRVVAVTLPVISVALFALPAHAGITITKVMYDPAGSNAGHQWIQVMNTGPDTIDLGAKNIRLFDASGNHLIKSYGDGGTSLQTGEDAIISQDPLTYVSDYPSYAGKLLKSTFKLPATMGMVGILETDGAVLAQSKYVAPPKVKQIAVSKSTTKGKRAASSITSTTTKSHGKGTVAPATSADVEVAGALPSMSPFEPLLASPWFAGFLGLLAFSSFSLILIQRQRNSYTLL